MPRPRSGAFALIHINIYASTNAGRTYRGGLVKREGGTLRIHALRDAVASRHLDRAALTTST